MEYRILGPLELVDDGRPVVLSARKQRALLLCLLLRANEVVSADALIDAVWGERPPSSAAKLVQVYVSQLRRALGEGAIETRAAGLRDGARARAARRRPLRARCSPRGRKAMAAANPALAAALLRRALDLWRGRPLEDADHAAFAVVEAGRLDELRLACVEERLDADLALGRHDEVLAEIASLVRRASAARPPARAAHARAVSLRAADRRARRLPPTPLASCATSSASSPAPQLRDLQHAILNQAAWLDAPRRLRRPPAAAIPVPSSALVGRRGELRDLTAMVTREDVRIVTVSGAGGSGKTRVALELARDRRRALRQRRRLRRARRRARPRARHRHHRAGRWARPRPPRSRPPRRWRAGWPSARCCSSSTTSSTSSPRRPSSRASPRARRG